jgi:hypothetical protein
VLRTPEARTIQGYVADYAWVRTATRRLAGLAQSQTARLRPDA